MSAWKLFCGLGQVRRLILEDGVDQRDVLVHLVADLGDIVGLVGPVLSSLQSTLAR